MIESDKVKYWDERSSEYSGFKWANDRGYLDQFLDAGEFGLDDWVLDLGCGPGIVAREIGPLVDRVIGLDNSIGMIKQYDGSFNLMFGDARDIPFPDSSFDKVVARNIFHHMTAGLLEAIRETHRVMKPGGRLIIGERVPPSDEVRSEYAEMLSLKDDRVVFTEDNLRGIVSCADFRLIKSFPVWIGRISVRDWLSKSGLPVEVRRAIWDKHEYGTREFQVAHNMIFKGDDCFIDIKNIVIVAEKK